MQNFLHTSSAFYVCWWPYTHTSSNIVFCYPAKVQSCSKTETTFNLLSHDFNFHTSTFHFNCLPKQDTRGSFYNYSFIISGYHKGWKRPRGLSTVSQMTTFRLQTQTWSQFKRTFGFQTGGFNMKISSTKWASSEYFAMFLSVLMTKQMEEVKSLVHIFYSGSSAVQNRATTM